MSKKQKLELTWIGKDDRPKLEPRILIEDSEKSYHAKKRVSENDIFDNRLILGDNLLALKSLEQEFRGKVKCVFIDPPYNTGNDFIYEDDFAENNESYLTRSMQKDEKGNRLVANTESNGRFHSDWLSMMYPLCRPEIGCQYFTY